MVVAVVFCGVTMIIIIRLTFYTTQKLLMIIMKMYMTHTHTARHENDADVDDDVNDNSFVLQFFIHLFMANILEFSFI